MPDITEQLETLKREVETLKTQLADRERTSIDVLRVTNPYTASSPTADGTIQVEVNGVQFNVLVDKV